MNSKKTVLATIVFVLSIIYVPAFAKDTFTVVSSPYVGWEPWAYADYAGILAKHAQKNGITIQYQRMNDYVGSINLFTAGEVDAVTATNMDALAFPSIGGVDTSVIIVGDFSNGNDGIMAKNADSVCDLKGRTIGLYELTVSHYILVRALEDQCGLKEKDVNIVNILDTHIAAAFIADPNAVVVTWNPMLLSIRNEKGGKLLYDSSQIPGEIIDMLIVRTDAPESLKKALVGAWYETLGIMSGRGKAADDAIAYMAEVTGATIAEYRAQLRTTAMFYSPAKAAQFVQSPKLKTTMKYVRDFAFEHGLFAEDAPNADVIGIEFHDGSVLGDAGNIKLRFDPSFALKAANGTL